MALLLDNCSNSRPLLPPARIHRSTCRRNPLISFPFGKAGSFPLTDSLEIHLADVARNVPEFDFLNFALREEPRRRRVHEFYFFQAQRKCFASSALTNFLILISAVPPIAGVSFRIATDFVPLSPVTRFWWGAMHPATCGEERSAKVHRNSRPTVTAYPPGFGDSTFTRNVALIL